MPVLSQDLNSQRHISWPFLCSVNSVKKLRWEVIVRFVNISEIDCHHCLIFFSILRLKVFNQHIIFFISTCRLTNMIHWPCYLIVGQLIFIDPGVVLSMFMLTFIFMIVCGLFEWKWIWSGFFLSFVNIYIAVGDPIINDTMVINRINTAIYMCLSPSRTMIPKDIGRSLFLCLMVWGERWLLVLLTLVELLTITLFIFYQNKMFGTFDGLAKMYVTPYNSACCT